MGCQHFQEILSLFIRRSFRIQPDQLPVLEKICLSSRARVLNQWNAKSRSNSLVPIGQQFKRQMILLLEFLLGFDRIEADPKDFYTLLLQFSVRVTKAARLSCASWRHCFWIEVNQCVSGFACLCEINCLSILVLSCDLRDRVTKCEFTICLFGRDGEDASHKAKKAQCERGDRFHTVNRF